ncbi:fibrocystin-L-like [Watersipora subatra]|uniref:fibrocystin-L-like n=1 Tax=Watersipora subatra TaxID=2589382 RepID=UPI00355B04A0
MKVFKLAAISAALCLLLITSHVQADDVWVSHIYPSKGSKNGGMQLTIYGDGFAKNQFNYGAGSEHLGNSVLMVSATRSYECDIHKDGCNEKQIVCFTKAMIIDDYTVQVKVDGVMVPDNLHCASHAYKCVFTPSESYTPYLSSIVPRPATPGAIVTMSGKIITDLFSSNVAASSNGRSEQMLRVYVGGQKCELFEDFDLSLPYGVGFTSDTSLYGWMNCKMEGSYVSNLNASFLVDIPYGRSLPELQVLKLFADNSIAMLQTYARIDSVSPASGSIEGGTLLTIEGDNFDNTSKPVEVKVADSNCEVQQQSKTEIVCKTATNPGVAPPYRGGRGLTHSVVYAETTDLDNIPALVNQPDDTSVIDSLYISYNKSASSQTFGFLVAPQTGNYSFETKIVDKTFSSLSQSHDNIRHHLIAGEEYYVELEHTSLLDADNLVSVALRMYQTDKTSSQTGSAVNERQKLTMTSSVVPETQLISFANWNLNSNAVHAVQTIDVVPTTYGYVTEYRLSMDGAYSRKITTEATDSTVAAAINSMTTVSPDVVTVQRSSISSGGYRYTVTFMSERGPWSDLSYIALEPLAVVITVNTVTVGVPSYKQAVLSMDGRYSKAISTTASIAKMTETMEELFSVGCPGSIVSHGGAAFQEDFESQPVGWSSPYRGLVIINQYPLCGRKSIQNPSYIMNKESADAVFISQNHYVCFGYHGFLTNSMTFTFAFVKDGEQHTETQRFYEAFAPFDGRWHYQCVDVYTILTTAYPTGNYFQVYRVQVGLDYSRKTLIDNIYFGSKSIDEPEIHDLRLMPPHEYLMNDVIVTSPATGEYQVELFPVNCSSPFFLMTAVNGPSDISRVVLASPPITGSFDTNYNNHWVRGIPADVTQENLQAFLETLPGIGGLSVTRSGLCHSYEWTVDWLQVGGDRPSLILDNSNIQGVNANITQSTVQDGYAEFNPIIGDMLFQSHDTPQVTVNVNGIPSLCAGSCEFEWSESDTPSITSVTPSSGGADVTLTLTGTGLAANAEIFVGKDSCNNINLVGNNLTCDLTSMRRGIHEIKVFITGKGRADCDLTYEFVSEVSLVSPTSGHLSGGYLVTLTGSGLTEEVTIEHTGGTCHVLIDQSNSDIVVCQVQPSATSGPVDFLLVFNDGTNLTVPDAFTFLDTTSSSVITSVSTSVSSVLGGSELIISGTGFGSSISDVSIGYGNAANVTEWRDTQIVVVLPSLDLGSYTLLVSTDSGYADLSTNSIPEIVYRLEVTDISPRLSSKYGGSKHTITGFGFGENSTAINAKIGTVACKVETVTNTVIECVTEPSAQHHSVDNLGTHAQYGQYYAWNPSSLDIQVGDIVDWSWTSPPGVSNVKYTVQQTDEVSSSDPTRFGIGYFQEPSAAGTYSYEFTQEGIFYYWSAPVDPTGAHIMRGKVEVLPKDPWSGDVHVMLGGHLAETNIAARKKRNARVKRETCIPEQSSCAVIGPGIVSNCIEDEVIVNSISPNNGTSEEIITLTGRGFSLSDCNNIIKFGGSVNYQALKCVKFLVNQNNTCVLVEPKSVFADANCTILSSSETDVQCKLSLDPLVEPGVILPASMIVDNLGSALFNITGEWNKGYTLLPKITDVSHDGGSLKGGQLLTIKGDGFLMDGRTQVSIANVPCEIQSLNYTEIRCTTGEAGVWSGDIRVSVLSARNEILEAVCVSSCTFAYSSTETPSLLSVTPQEVTGAADIVLAGSLFGTDSFNLVVYASSVECVITLVTDSEVQCSLPPVSAGNHTISVLNKNLGYAAYSQSFAGLSSLYVTSLGTVTAVTPSSGSIHGGTLITIEGAGFFDETLVECGGAVCEIKEYDATSIQCETPAADTTDMCSLQFHGTPDNSAPVDLLYSFNVDDTPTITSVTPNSGVTGEMITIAGTLLRDANEITLDDATCVLVSATSSEITCTLGEHAAGRTDLIVNVDGKGKSAAVPFTYELQADLITPARGTFGGEQGVTITGAGMDDSITVAICGELCTNVAVTSSQVVCTTPSHAMGVSNVICDVVVTLSTENVTLTSAYTYDTTLGGHVTGMTPKRGGTAGGTDLTITGSSLNHPNAAVFIDGVDCPILDKNASVIVCNTGAHAISGKFDVKVLLGTDGLATTQAPIEFYYIDVWSSRFTWGGYPLPAEGEIVVVRSGQTLLLDMDTPILKVLLIQGGKLVFDEKDVELNAENILITDGGTLEVGTEDEPFQHRAIITLHGHLRSLEMPIYGAKTLALRNGTLDLHGIPKVSWTVLGSSANAGDFDIVLQQPVDWEVGDEIAIASTGHRHSQKENEKRQIAAVSSDGRTITLNESLTYSHLGETRDLGGGHMLEMKAEVGLLSHNVVVRGSINHQWDETIEACEAGFDTGQFATQTCFQGRFGEEMGSDEFGGAIMMHSPVPDENWVIGRLSHIEVTHAGQAFRLGRYPIHFHLNGHQNMSYVKGCSIHRTFNRAINVHNTHDVLIENNVIYHIKGGALFLEDSIETGNIIQYNLAIFVTPSSSLLNDDVTPAAFWVTHPTNIIRHNHAAGGSHFGFWYRMHTHPTGPSADSSLCPKNAPLGEFRNNTAHSLGWFGLWTFPDYFPMDGDGVCSQRTQNIPAVFETLTAWHCEKGAEWVNGGDLQFDGFVMANNEKAGIEGKLNLQHTQYSFDGPIIINSVIAAQTGEAGCTDRGIILPFSSGFMVHNTEFIGFNTSNCAALGVTSIDGKCSFGCGGYTYMFSEITKTNSPQMGAYRWEHEAAYHDLDGTLTGTADAKVVPTNPSLDPNICTASPDFSIGNPGGSVCDTPLPFHRYSWNNAQPASLDFKNALLTTEHGTSFAPWLKKRLTHPFGWMVMLMGHTTYNLTYENGGHFTNTSNTGVFYMFNDTDYVIMGQQLYQRPDRFQVAAGPLSEGSENELTYEDNVHGDWHLSDELMFTYLVSGKTSVAKRSLGYGNDKSINFRVFTCFFNDCVPPPDPNQVPPPTTRPDDAIFWSQVTNNKFLLHSVSLTQDSAWEKAEDGWGGNNGDGTFSPPVDDKDVKIFNEDWVVLDTQPARINKLYIYGVLEFEPAKINGEYLDFTLSATHILLFGGRLFVGWEDNPMKGNVEIVLRGDWSTEEQYLPFGGPTVGAKAIGVFGSLDIHGMNRSIYWTRLSQEASVGSAEITVVDSVDWVTGDEIVISTSGLSAWESEVRKITAVSSDRQTLTLNTSLNYKHTALKYRYEGYNLDMSAEVGLLSRNVKVRGEAHSDLQKQSFGGRILVSDYFDGTQQWTGYARISDTEFYHMGQEGYINYEDPRFSLSFLNTGPVSEIKPSYIKQNSFKDSFNTAIGVIDADGIIVEDNIIHGTVDAGIRIKSTNSTLRRNLVTFTQARACYQERMESDSFFYHGSIEVLPCSTGVTLTDNAVAGSERSGYSIAGYSCESADLWSGNVAHGTLSGVVILPEYPAPTPCVKVSGFTVYHTFDYGIYTQTSAAVLLEDLVLADNKVGVLSLIMGPEALSHQFSNKQVQLSNSLIVGSTDQRDCSMAYDADPDSCNLDTTSTARSWTSNSGGSIAMAFGQFMSGSNVAPSKPWKGLMTYNSNAGLTTVKDVVFAKFGLACGGNKRDVIFSTSPGNEDLQHPMEVSSLTLIDVDDESKAFYHRPSVSKINSADCVDMDCDAKKKCMIKDLDGSLLGEVGAVIPQSEFEWDGDPRRGLGDYRIPKTMLTDLEGNRLDVDEVAPYKGIIGNRDCEYVSEWQAHKCTGGYNYEMLVIESMDSDTETRRLSPVAVLGEKYIDLINGPQDHGWCSGYTCRKRVSTFMALVATDVHYALYFTSTAPQHLRLTMLNSGPNEMITLEIYNTISNRIDVYVDGELIEPLNAKMVDGELVYTSPDFYCQYCPQNQPSVNHGDNFQNRWEQLIYVAVSGESSVDIVLSNMIMLTFDLVMTEDEFFGEELANNLAIFFGVDPSKVRVVNVISEDSQLSEKRRRKRALPLGQITVEVELGDSPTAGINDTVTDSLSTEQLLEFRDQLIDSVQTGALSALINVPISQVYVTVPLPDPSDPEWDALVDNADNNTDVIRVPSKLALHDHPTSFPEGSIFEGINIKLVDDEDEIVTDFGQITWRVGVRLTSPGNGAGVLTGTQDVPLIQGWANFTDLSISNYGSDFELEYFISSPVGASYVDSVRASFELVKKEFDVLIEVESFVTSNETTDMLLTLVDQSTTTPIASWNGLRFRAFLSLNVKVDYKEGEMTSPISNIFDTAYGNVSIPISFSKKNAYVVDIQVVSYPVASYGTTATSDIIIAYPEDYVAPNPAVTKYITLTFDGSESEDNLIYFEVALYNELLHNYDAVTFAVLNCSNSLTCQFQISGDSDVVDERLLAMWEAVKGPLEIVVDGMSYTSQPEMTVNGENYYGNDESAVEPVDDVIIIYIIVGVTGGVLLIILVITIVFIRQKKGRSKIKDSTRSLGFDLEEDFVTYIGAPPISSKMPPIDTKREELLRANERLSKEPVYDVPSPTITPTKIAVKPISKTQQVTTPRWRY